MSASERAVRTDAATRGSRAEAILVDLFRNRRWTVRTRSRGRAGARRPDFVVRCDDTSYAVEVKTSPEGRSDRLIPLWAQACLQAMRAAGDDRAPLAVVAAPRIAPRAAEQVLEFAAHYAPDVAAAVVDFAGLRRFRGPRLDGFDADADRLHRGAGDHRASADLWSDLNQWMLKVLLAPELPDTFLSAPRDRYRNASQLARAAEVSVMSAFRFVRQLRRAGHLAESTPYLTLVRREELFRRWHAWAVVRPVREVPLRFLLHGDPRVELGRLFEGGRACRALFAAADALGLGFVHGVPPYVYVPQLGRATLAAWKHVVPVDRGEPPDVLVRAAPTPQSIFRGVVRAADGPACDVIQLWLDVASHPARGAEQAEEIRRRVLAPLIDGRAGA